MKVERNSEGKLTLMAVVGLVVASIVAVVSVVVTSGALEPWPTAAAIAAVVLSIGKMVGDYTVSRPGKTNALNQLVVPPLTGLPKDPSDPSER